MKRLGLATLIIAGGALVAVLGASGRDPVPVESGADVADRTRQPAMEPGVGREVLDLFDPEEPLFIVGSEAASVSDAAAAVGSEIYLPSEDANLGEPELWVNDETGEVGARYDTGIVVLQTPWPEGRDVTSSRNPYESKAESLGAGETRLIADRPAFLLPMNSRKGIDGTLEPPVNTIQVYVDGYDVTLLSPTASMANLEMLAASLTSQSR